ncbi:hypothetical protein QC761_0070930 [Podospora bellae-mahoneyi]|uniref:Heterokaryon incompatibility domain-containing protein n=1 Tax=Podospora bellae-mahoneyi TaxID=2093777 RepID=A0ABR0FJ46_9PEZI|nr:hypothetical protein QC761_0070930 [Podospora bellae-mahoneyi]
MAPKSVYVKENGKRIWTTILECILQDSRCLTPYVSFKGKKVQKAVVNSSRPKLVKTNFLTDLEYYDDPEDILSAQAEFEEFIGSDIPPYAILSHTWEDGEVSLADMRSGRYQMFRSKKGYKKIEMTCLLAKKDGYQYAWVDICCIDKSSSAELTEAINSMYQWYLKSAVCYVFLSDLPPSRVSPWRPPSPDADGSRVDGPYKSLSPLRTPYSSMGNGKTEGTKKH